MFPPGHPPSAGNSEQDPDAPVRATDTDASLARLSAVKKLYLADPFIQHFVPRAHLQPARPPLINIGTYVRSGSIDRLVEAWVDMCRAEERPCQIVSLGAGSDTRFWRIATGARGPSVVRYVEVDFAEITSKKAMAIRKSKELSAVLGRPEDVIVGNGGTTLQSACYHLLAADLRLPPATSLGPLLTPQLLDPKVPTLLLFECVLVYMTPSESSALIQWFVDYFADAAPLGCIVYEMFGLEDSFGKVMLENLKTRNVELPGAAPYPTVSSLRQRFLHHDFSSVHALTLRTIRTSYIPAEELERISKLEMLDEIEELELVLGHYAITWGVKGDYKDWGLRMNAEGYSEI